MSLYTEQVAKRPWTATGITTALGLGLGAIFSHYSAPKPAPIQTASIAPRAPTPLDCEDETSPGHVHHLYIKIEDGKYMIKVPTKYASETPMTDNKGEAFNGIVCKPQP